MNRPDDDFPDLHDELRAAMGVEPPMTSLPEDDVARGRLLARRRRWVAVGAAAAVVPAMALGAYAISTSLETAPGSGAPAVVLQPAGATEASADGNQDNQSMDPVMSACETGTAAPGLVDQTPVTAGPNDGGASAASAPTGADAGSLGSGGDPSTVDCLASDDGPPMNSAETDRIIEALSRHVDPDGTHAGTSIIGAAASAGDTVSGVYAGLEWVDGDRTGSVSLSVEDSALGGSDSCLDRSLVGGPQVTCEQRTLADGTTVLVGRGEQDGAQRVSVRYVRPDGSVVWATADEATEQWWDDKSGAAPLLSAPATVDQLIDLVRDPDVHL